MGALHFIALHTTVARVFTLISNSARMSILFEPELSLAVKVMAVDEFFGRLGDLINFMTHCPLVAVAVACAADLRHSLTAFGNSLPDGLDKSPSTPGWARQECIRPLRQHGKHPLPGNGCFPRFLGGHDSQ